MMIENSEEIILDDANNVIVGPEGYFKVVIDEFDGTSVKEWHLEDSKGNKTLNLAGRAKGQNIDLLVNARCRTTAQFISRIATGLLIQLQAENNALRSTR